MKRGFPIKLAILLIKLLDQNLGCNEGNLTHTGTTDNRSLSNPISGPLL